MEHIEFLGDEMTLFLIVNGIIRHKEQKSPPPTPNPRYFYDLVRINLKAEFSPEPSVSLSLSLFNLFKKILIFSINLYYIGIDILMRK